MYVSILCMVSSTSEGSWKIVHGDCCYYYYYSKMIVVMIAFIFCMPTMFQLTITNALFAMKSFSKC